MSDDTSDLLEQLRTRHIKLGFNEVTESLFSAAADEIERLNAENARLREALECLIDEQNGPPLLGHERSWCAAMEKARAALGEEKGCPTSTIK